MCPSDVSGHVRQALQNNQRRTTNLPRTHRRTKCGACALAPSPRARTGAGRAFTVEAGVRAHKAPLHVRRQ
jgi:hypothetical protein